MFPLVPAAKHRQSGADSFTKIYCRYLTPDRIHRKFPTAVNLIQAFRRGIVGLISFFKYPVKKPPVLAKSPLRRGWDGKDFAGNGF